MSHYFDVQYQCNQLMNFAYFILSFFLLKEGGGENKLLKTFTGGLSAVFSCFILQILN